MLSYSLAITQLLQADTDLLRKNWSSVTMQRTVATTSNCKGLQRANLLQQSAMTQEIYEIDYAMKYFRNLFIFVTFV